MASDLVIVPIEPGGASRWSSNLTVRQLKEAQVLKPTLKCGFVVSRKIQGTVLGRRHAPWRRYRYSDLRHRIEQRIAYAEALTMGKTVFEWGGNNAAMREIQSLNHELLDAFKPDEQVLFPTPKPPQLTADVISAFERRGAGQDTRAHISPIVENRESTNVGDTTEVVGDIPKMTNGETGKPIKVGKLKTTNTGLGIATKGGPAERTRRLSVDLPESWHRRFKIACTRADKKMIARYGLHQAAHGRAEKE